MNNWMVRNEGLYWSVRRSGDSTWNAPVFQDEAAALSYAHACAKSNRPASVEVYDVHGKLIDRAEYT
jgi:hypothetical protein